MASYLRPALLSDALAALAAGPKTLLAGGTDHFPARVTVEPDEDILDITALPGLHAITRDDNTPGQWRIPALATWTSLVEKHLPPLFDGLKQAAIQVGGRQIQNTGTLVGNICNASPAADGIPPLLALDASVELQSVAGTRTLPLVAFVQGPRRTARRPDEMVTAILLPHRDARSSFSKLGGRRYLVISICMLATTITQDRAGRITHAAIAVGACGPVATRLPALEAALIGKHPYPALVRPEHLAPLAPIDDLRGPASYRHQATLELLRRSLATQTATPMEHAA
jgi:CO/xanthine dehydrogenase FAD-binding subunit